MSTFSPYASGVFALLGTVIGGLITFSTQRTMAREARDADANAIRLGIAAEIESYLTVVLRRNHAALAEWMLTELRSGRDVELRGFVSEERERMEDVFPIFYSNISKLGALGKHVGEIANFYQSVAAVRATVFRMEAGGYDTYDINQKEGLVDRELVYWQETVASGRRLVSRLHL